MRFFNTAGPVRSADHYCIPPLERFELDEILLLIQQQKYFVAGCRSMSYRRRSSRCCKDIGAPALKDAERLQDGSHGDHGNHGNQERRFANRPTTQSPPPAHRYTHPAPAPLHHSPQPSQYPWHAGYSDYRRPAHRSQILLHRDQSCQD